MTVDRDKAQRAVVELLKAFGCDPEIDPTLAQAPALVVESWERDWLYGYGVDIRQLFAMTVTNELHGSPVVVLSKIAVSTLCPHHLLPAEGVATVAYLPGRHLLGIGTLAHLVDAYSRRFTFQEQIGSNVVGALMLHGEAKGAHCRLDMQHDCVRLRGAKQPATLVTTTHYAGSFATAEGRKELEAAMNPGPSA
jgi:GTP cyclohydrolase IA